MPGGYFFKALGQWTDYRTRARRTEFWLFTLVAWLIEVFALAITAMVVNPALDSDTMTLAIDQVTLVGWICITVTFALAVVIFFPFLAVAVRRMHDLGRSKWWVLFFFTPLALVGWIMAMFDGQPTTNKYGPDPKGRG
ncbi:DUF805 domain-containing protein [Demequina sp.]|uniref:DUF805 domain-containing protein n=1 Tax=Demequina sp. TaxID=2050685 RepID=UPI003D09D2E2